MWWRNMSWWSRRTACGHTLLVIHLANQNMLFGINLQNPSRTVTHSLSSLFSLQQYNYTHCRPQEHSLCRKGNSTIQCCFPCCTCDNGMEKYWHSWRHRSGPNTFVSLMLHVSAGSVIATRCEGGKGVWKWIAWGRLGLGAFPGLLNGMWLFWLMMQKSVSSHH